MEMWTPPHIVFWDESRSPLRPDNVLDLDDYQWLTSAPIEAVDLYRERLYSDAPEDCPCAWLDVETRRGLQKPPPAAGPGT